MNRSYPILIAALGKWQLYASGVFRVVSLGAQGPDNALAIEQEVERVSDADHEQGSARHCLDGATFTHIDGNGQAPGIPDRGEPQPVVPSIAENGNGRWFDAKCRPKCRQIVTLEHVMIVGRDLVMQRDRQALELFARRPACV